MYRVLSRIEEAVAGEVSSASTPSAFPPASLVVSVPGPRRMSGPGPRDPPRFAVTRAGADATLKLTGAWTTQNLTAAVAAPERAVPSDAVRVRVDISGLTALDTAGAWLVTRTLRHLRKAGHAVELVGSGAAAASLIETVARSDVPVPPPPPPDNPLVAIVVRIGRASVFIAREARDLINFLGLTVIVLGRLGLRPWRLRFTALVSHMERAGLNALPIVGLIAFLIGVVLAYQGADQLARFGAQIFTVNLVGIGVLREMGILLTAIMVAGRSGSAFTAQIGTMAVNEEIDAMRTIGLDPMEVLVAPRVIALVLVMPLLTFYADLMGLLGGAVMATAVLDISFVRFARQLSEAVTMWSFWVGIIKAPLFGFIIAMIGCYEGLKVARNAESVGRQTTRAVVEAVFLVIVLDALFSILFSVLGI
ncbi:MAG: MlaE family lipid ABC transporter permease subunit [Alphaproteobacteria bacterium]|nr:MAG: MlaE family lipid ABC transporter permease subunit [Alphaproteobacteria bacterium]